MFRTALAALALSFAAALTGCDEGGPSPPPSTPLPSPEPTVLVRVSPPPKPAAVPAAAQPIVQTSTLGRITRRAHEEPQIVMLRELLGGTCQNAVVTIRTSEETIYASLLCDRFSEEVFDDLFTGEEAAIVLEVTEERFRILIKTLGGAQAEFTPDGIWVE